MPFDAHKNFAYSTVAAAPSPAISGTSLTVQTGHGSRFDYPMNVVVWPASTQPLLSNAEILRCTNISGDVLTVVRTQEGTSARTIQIGDQIAAATTAKIFTDLEEAIPVLVEETLTGTKNGSNTSFTTAGQFKTGTTRVRYNGLVQTLGASFDYEESGNDTIIFSLPPISSDTLIIDYEQL